MPLAFKLEYQKFSWDLAEQQQRREEARDPIRKGLFEKAITSEQVVKKSLERLLDENRK